MPVVARLYKKAKTLPYNYPSGEISGNIFLGGEIEWVWMITQEEYEANFKKQNNLTLTSASELKDVAVKKLYEKYLRALEFEKGYYSTMFVIFLFPAVYVIVVYFALRKRIYQPKTAEIIEDKDS